MNKVEIFEVLEESRLKEILGKINDVRIGLIGDICLDIYWQADMTRSELSRETPHFPLPVVKEWMSPGAGGNVAANQAALRPEIVKVLGIIGDDWRGKELFRCFEQAGINIESIVMSSTRITTAYAKPLRKGISDIVYEDPRLDFGNYGPLSKDDEEQLIFSLKRMAGSLDILCVSDQLPFGCITDAVRNAILDLAADGLKVVVDSRDRISMFRGAILKPNELEAWRAVNGTTCKELHDLRDIAGTAKQLAIKTESKICMTAGPQGSIYTDGDILVHVPSRKVDEPIDICGAGDTFLSAFSSSLAAGADFAEAAYISNLASEVTIAKTGTTGTATPEEILARYAEASENKYQK